MPNRAIDLVQNIRFLGSEIGKRKPAVFLSGGNHMHLPAKFASLLSGHRQRMRLGLRASNSSVRTRSEEHTSELQSLMRISYAVFCLKKKKYISSTKKQHYTRISQISITIQYRL